MDRLISTYCAPLVFALPLYQRNGNCLLTRHGQTGDCATTHAADGDSEDSQVSCQLMQADRLVHFESERGHQDLDCKQALGDKGRRALKNPYRYVVGRQCTVFVSWHL